MLYCVKVFCDRWRCFCYEKFALFIKVYMKTTVRQMAPMQQANIGNIFMSYYVKLFCDRWRYFCHEKFALLIKVYMNTTDRQMVPLQQANIGNISMPKCVSVLWQMAPLLL